MTQVSYAEFLGSPHCLVKHTVALREGDLSIYISILPVADREASVVKIYVFRDIAYKPPSRPNPPTDLGIPSMGMIFRAESESGGPRT